LTKSIFSKQATDNMIKTRTHHNIDNIIIQEDLKFALDCNSLYLI